MILDVSTHRTKVLTGTRGVVPLPFESLPSAAATREVAVRMSREDVIAGRGSSLCSEHVDGDCFEARSLLRYVHGDRSYMRKPGRTSKSVTHSLSSGDARQCQLGRGEEKSTSVRRYLFVRCVRVFPLFCSGNKESGVQ